MDSLEYESAKMKVEELDPKIDKLEKALGVSSLEKQRQELEYKSSNPKLWEDPQNAQSILQSSNKVAVKLNKFKRLKETFNDAKTMLEISKDENDKSIVAEIIESLNEIEQEIENQTLGTLLTGEYDSKNAILTLHAGAGGTEAMDWAQMLFRMYSRFAEKKGFRVKVLDFLEGDKAGIKSISFLIEGENVYGYFKGEAGVHRLVRVSPFDESGRRHTSFASLEVVPEIDDGKEVEIREEDIKMDVYRSSGAGGQHVNKTSSAVRLTHIPTGVVTACQNERSQMQNRMMALKMLKSKLVEIKEREHLDKIEDIKGVQKDIAWGSQIRSYVFMPYTLVKDHRTGFENANVNAVMDGDLDGFINAYLVYKNDGGAD